MRNLGTYIADKLNQSNESRKKVSIALTVCTDLFCLVIALLESGFWSKIFGESYTWNGVSAYLSMENEGYRAGGAIIIPTLINLDSDLPVPAGSSLEDILMTFVTGLILFVLLKVVNTVAFRKLGMNV